MFKDFKTFISKGNVIDLAVGIIIGASFGRIVSSLVSDVLMPPIGLFLGKVDFSNLFISLSGGHYDTLQQAKSAGAVTMNYGLFINHIIDFLIVAIVTFFLVQWINKINKLSESKEKSEKKSAQVTTKECPFCITQISLKATKCPSCTSILS